MKSNPYSRYSKCVVALLVLGLLLWGQTALASEGAASWRGTYDTAMKWLNFFILAFLIVKFGRTPLKNFLEGQKENVAVEIKSLENEKAAVQSKVEEARTLLAQSDIRAAEIKEKIIRQAEAEKERMIQEAMAQSRLMLESAKRRVESKIHFARASFMAELVDMAVAAAMEKLPTEITPEDDRKYQDLFMAQVESI
ncbi:MAG: ATP synthase F0 subunit B [Desulfobacterales bacterium]|jgi:F-type H+-transporting ATPase subunit b|nr:ATP synthase F0 subunit B [Desulfobacterales bacterium]